MRDDEGGRRAPRRPHAGAALTNFGALLTRLSQAGVEFVVIGGLAVLTYGHVRAMLDLDVCCARTPENLERIEAALAPIHPGCAAHRRAFRFFSTSERFGTG